MIYSDEAKMELNSNTREVGIKRNPKYTTKTIKIWVHRNYDTMIQER